MQQAIAPVGQARTEYDIYSALASPPRFFRSALPKVALKWTGCATCITGRASRRHSSRSTMPEVRRLLGSRLCSNFHHPTQPPVLFAAFWLIPHCQPAADPVRPY